jgi:ribosome biogenesis GTPase A
MAYNGNEGGGMDKQTIQWFPGHMAKTRKLITENLRLVDVVVELLDARLPHSSRNPLLNDLTGDKPRVLVLAKADLAEEEYNRTWTVFFRSQGMNAVPCNLKGANFKVEMKAVTDGVRAQASDIIARRQTRGIISRVVRVMVTGIPNVGKSTLINLLAGKARAETGDRPGVTKGKQWIRLEHDLELLDMPGILWPNLEDWEGARKLAVTGAIGENAYHPQELALWLIGWLREHRPGRLTGRYGVSESGQDKEIADILKSWNDDPFRSDSQWEHGFFGDSIADWAGGAEPIATADHATEAAVSGGGADLLSLAILEAIGKRRGFLRKGGLVERDKASVMLLDELRGGRLGRITWDEPPSIKGQSDEKEPLEETGEPEEKGTPDE